ncbi:sensor histidine kinase YesM [Runella defluvii]|uniref:Sensor histidine kinase YesM n=1 Tax=Runella defluvii TaxID=370973 RepID=A0A7W5ZGS8_9BACT|nr:histidine kinase [Runella defluvii]MBB3836604.1 sensor histidine kinase YesM [Runella defluvii]
MINWQKKLIWGVRLGELLAVVGVYFVLYALYCLTLTFNELSYVKMTYGALLLNYAVSQFFDYALKFILTIPLWYFYFRVIPHWKLSTKILLHVFTMLLFVFTWQKAFYFTMDTLGRGHLRGSSQVWDIYIPALIYVIQFGFFHAYEYHLHYQRQKETENALRQASLESELSAIKAQLNPHFLYNVFNTISASVPPEMEDTREMIAKLADLFRYQLKASRVDFVKLKDEMEFVEKYLALEKDRFGSRLQTTIEVDEALMTERVPPMLLQPIVENAIKHGISPKIEGGEVKITIKKSTYDLIVEVTDTGVGLVNEGEIIGKGVGLTNTKLRLEKMFGKTLHFQQNQPSGFRVWFEIPLH